MSAVWRASRAAVKRRRLQTFVIGLVVLCSTTTILLALGLLDAASAPFDRAFDQQRGAHTAATFDTREVSKDELEKTGTRPGVQAAAGPFGQTVLDIPEDFLWMPAGPVTVVGRPGPDGPVDHVQLMLGDWATRPGEIVVSWPNTGTPNPKFLGTELRAEGAPPLTIVGFATSMSKTAGAWVSPEQMTALRPTSAQMLYRFDKAGSEAQVRASLDRATEGLPSGALAGQQSYLKLKKAYSAKADSYLPFMVLFGILGLLVSVLIVTNVVSGAVVSGHRHIGVLKSLGFTPNQVVAVYLMMVSVPALAGSLLGTLIGAALAGPILTIAFSGTETGSAIVGLDAWVPLTSLVAMLGVVVLAALVPSLRAHRLSAARAITAGSAPRTGRGLRVQRVLSGSRLPRAVSLGLGQPFTRPGRTMLTMAAIGLGVTTVTLTTGLTSTMVAYADRTDGDGAPVVVVRVGSAEHDDIVPKLNDTQTERMLRALPGAEKVTAETLMQLNIVGSSQPVYANSYRGDPPNMSDGIVEGRWLKGAGEVVVGPSFLTQRGMKVGDSLGLAVNGKTTRAKIVGKDMGGDARNINVSWQTLTDLAPERRATSYTVSLAPGSDAHAYAEGVRKADPGLHPRPGESGNSATTTVVGFSTVFTVLLTVVAALGVFNTVLLNTRERRRDLGMLKSIGMTPRQVVAMTVTSVAGLGLVAGIIGIPLGMVGHRLIVDHVGIVAFPESMKDVWHAPQLAGLALAGVTIAVLGALLPARSAARMTIAKVLHNE
ncbi:ABC transporter permease [Streptomyces sp. SID7499]|uniref:ABC transporter permease n=1 Tax=Streptomyces sp. SID7499 TaxID=2706086 RepID=A0A6G3XSN2_9ACTN|nr:ABC transporter permease [Streptomyces sp. SID7499]